jgi:hypothetical protein
VVVLRDVPDSREENFATSNISPHQQETNGVDASQIARDVLGKGVIINDAEIHESIDALRPTTTIVDEGQYAQLAKSLADGYNVRQLSQYLLQDLHRTSVEAITHREADRAEESTWPKKGIQKSSWRPGKTSLNQRHNPTGIVKKGDVSSTKSKVVEQILRRSWSLFINREMQQIGELEMMLESWQLSFLFDLYARSRPMHETLIDSPLLWRSSELRPDRADNVLRIIARKQDAEEIAERIENNLRKFVSLDVNVGVLEAPRASKQRTTSFVKLFETSLQAIQDRLYCIIERKAPDNIVIHAQSELTLHHARRALLSLVNLPSPTSIDFTTINTATRNSTDASPSEQAQPLNEQPDLGLRVQHLAADFGRLTEPTKLHQRLRTHEDITNAGFIARTELLRLDHARNLTDRLLDTKPPDPVYFDSSATGDSTWKLEEPLSHQSWEVQFCKFLYQDSKASDLKHLISSSFQQNKDSNGARSQSIPSTIQSQVPGIASLLSHFSVKSGTVQSPVLIANFMPSPFTKNGSLPLAKLPRIRIVYRIWDYPGQTIKRVLKLQRAQATFHEQELHVHLPQEVADLRITRRSMLHSVYDAPRHPQLQNFTRTLQDSLNRERTTLYGDPTIKIRLPSEPFTDIAESWAQDLREDHFEVEYFFQGFESVQALDFVPIKTAKPLEETDPWMRQIADEMPEHMALRYEEIDGGSVGGRRVRLKLQYPTAFWAAGVKLLDYDAHALRSEKVRIGSRWQTEQKYMRLMETSLRLAHALTRINNGELGTPSDFAQDERPIHRFVDVLGQ